MNLDGVWGGTTWRPTLGPGPRAWASRWPVVCGREALWMGLWLTLLQPPGAAWTAVPMLWVWVHIGEGTALFGPSVTYQELSEEQSAFGQL